MLEAFRKHWSEYLMEGAELGIFMVSASLFTILLYHPASPAVRAIPPEFARRVLMGLAMGLTAVGLVYSPWGKQSGAHLNPAFTLTFFRLGKVARWDAVFYVVAQFVGGLAGVVVAAGVLGGRIAHPAVNYVVTTPGPAGTVVAFVAELAITFLLMAVVLAVSNTPPIARWTGVCAGVLVATYISLEAPLSGMSMNPARTLASALPANIWTAFWIYFVAPPLGMLLAAELHVRLGRLPVLCAKLDHGGGRRCIFRCGYAS